MLWELKKNCQTPFFLGGGDKCTDHLNPRPTGTAQEKNVCVINPTKLITALHFSAKYKHTLMNVQNFNVTIWSLFFSICTCDIVHAPKFPLLEEIGRWFYKSIYIFVCVFVYVHTNVDILCLAFRDGFPLIPHRLWQSHSQKYRDLSRFTNKGHALLKNFTCKQLFIVLLTHHDQVFYDILRRWFWLFIDQYEQYTRFQYQLWNKLQTFDATKSQSKTNLPKTQVLRSW